MSDYESCDSNVDKESSSPENRHKSLPWSSKNKNSPSPRDFGKVQDQPEEINIVLLGESGVGKSTFINSFANYMKHASFEQAHANNLMVLIPARFTLLDRDYNEKLVEIGAKHENEYLADGASATQDVKTYVFYVTIEGIDYKIRLIDTPGMGDPRGIDRDNQHCDYILNYLGRLEKLHAICLLLKPTNTRLDVFLNYCISQILCRLEKSSTENIAFVFTNTRGANYTPGETYSSLKVLIEKIKKSNNVVLPLGKKNIFCFDNEAFRFLAALKQNVEFQDDVLEINLKSWEYSYKEIYRLLSYIVLLKPHDPKKTVSINHARKMVLQLSQPLAEIVQLLGDNIYQLEQHTNQLLLDNQSLDDLKKQLHMPVIDIRVKKLQRPVTVCTAPQCSTIYKVAGINKYHYEQRCHNPCYLNDVPKEIIGDIRLMDCSCIDRETQSCIKCGCRFNIHMHIYYETEVFQNKIIDENILQNIYCREDAVKEKERVINQICAHKDELEQEHKYIIKCSAAFAHFLQKNAITPINDAFKEYVKYLITREESLGINTNQSTLENLRRLLIEYEQERSVLEKALQHQTLADQLEECTPAAIDKKIRDLFQLKHFGKKIKQLYDIQQTGSLEEHKQSEHVVQEIYKLSLYDTMKYWYRRGVHAFGFGPKPPNIRTCSELEEEAKYQQFYQGPVPQYGIPYYEFIPQNPQSRINPFFWQNTSNALQTSQTYLHRNRAQQNQHVVLMPRKFSDYQLPFERSFVESQVFVNRRSSIGYKVNTKKNLCFKKGRHSVTGEKSSFIHKGSRKLPESTQKANGGNNKDKDENDWEDC